MDEEQDPYQDEVGKESSPEPNKKKRLVAGAALLACLTAVILATVIPLVVLKDDATSDDAATVAPTPAPTPAPTCAEAFERTESIYHIWLQGENLDSDPFIDDNVWTNLFSDAFDELLSSTNKSQDACAPILTNVTLVEQRQKQLGPEQRIRRLQGVNETNSAIADTSNEILPSNWPSVIILSLRVQGNDTETQPLLSSLLDTVFINKFKHTLKNYVQNQQSANTNKNATTATPTLQVSKTGWSTNPIDLGLLLPPSCTSPVQNLCTASILPSMPPPREKDSNSTANVDTCSQAVAQACFFNTTVNAPAVWIQWNDKWDACTSAVWESCGWDLSESDVEVDGPNKNETHDEDRDYIVCPQLPECELTVNGTLSCEAEIIAGLLEGCNFLLVDNFKSPIEQVCSDHPQSRLCWPDDLADDEKRVLGLPLWRVSLHTCIQTFEEVCNYNTGLDAKMPWNELCYSSDDSTTLLPCVTKETPCCCDLVESWLEGWNNDTALDTNIWSSFEERREQRYAMAMFYCELNGDTWSRPNLWLSDQHECDWLKSTDDNPEPCNAEERVTVLRPIPNMIGTLPPEVGLLTSLWELNLYNSSIYGRTTAVNYQNLTQLDTLILSNNYLSGWVGDFVWKFPDMVHLDLSNNQFTGIIPDDLNAYSPNLKILDLSYNQFVGTLSMAFDFLELETLRLNNNFLEGPISEDLKLDSMEYLWLNSNNLMGEIPSSFGLESSPKLRELTLYDNPDLTGDLSAVCELFSDPGVLQVASVDRQNVACECCSDGDSF